MSKHRVTLHEWGITVDPRKPLGKRLARMYRREHTLILARPAKGRAA